MSHSRPCDNNRPFCGRRVANQSCHKSRNNKNVLNIQEKITTLTLYIQYKYICMCFIERYEKPDCYKKN